MRRMLDCATRNVVSPMAGRGWNALVAHLRTRSSRAN